MNTQYFTLIKNDSLNYAKWLQKVAGTQVAAMFMKEQGWSLNAALTVLLYN